MYGLEVIIPSSFNLIPFSIINPNIIKEETEKLLKENPDMFRGGPKSHSSIGPHEIAPGAQTRRPESHVGESEDCGKYVGKLLERR